MKYTKEESKTTKNRKSYGSTFETVSIFCIVNNKVE